MTTPRSDLLLDLSEKLTHSLEPSDELTSSPTLHLIDHLHPSNRSSPSSQPQRPPTPKPTVRLAAQPRFGAVFDPWYSSASGHQRADEGTPIGASTGWREIRSDKLGRQFGDGRRRTPAQAGNQSVRDMLIGRGATKISKIGSDNGNRKSSKALVSATDPTTPKKATRSISKRETELVHFRSVDDGPPRREALLGTSRPQPDDNPPRRRVFDGLVVYINGSTYPAVSDHKLKALLVEHGARLSVSLARCAVTHVVLGKPAAGRPFAGAGGGLAASKIQKEIGTVRGCGIKYVAVEWVLQSVQAGRKLPEAEFENLRLAHKTQVSVYSIFKKPAAAVAASQSST